MSNAFSSLAVFLRRPAPPPPDRAAVTADLERLEKLYRHIHSRIQDAEEEGEAPNQTESLYLNDLRDIALDADDVLDEWRYELLRAEAEEGGGPNKRKRCGAPDQALLLLASRSGEITGRFHAIDDEYGTLRLRTGDGVRRRGPRSRPPPSSSLVDERYVYGRDDDKDILVGYMLDRATSDHLSVIPIVGMGLVGKTTLAQLIYNEPEVVKAFPLKGWVSLNRDNDLTKLLKRAVESFTLQACSCDQLDAVQGLLQRCLVGKRFLLILDDVCREHLWFWDQFKASLFSCSRGSVVLLTTKIGEVAETTKTVQAFYMFERMPDDCCWSTFKKHAFDGQGSVKGLDEEVICQKVSEICDGMPSLAKLLGVSFRSRFDREAWIDFMEYVVEDEILPALRTSYHVLPGHLKPCLLYCSLFPKGYLFNKTWVVRLWMAQGLILPKNKKRAEDVGIQYFNELISRSFFLQSEIDEQAYFMPNPICDLLYSISKNECSRVEDMHNLPLKVRHLSLVRNECMSVTSFYQYSSLRSFLVMRTFPYTSVIHIEIQDDMFCKLSHLRSLDLSYTDIQTVPDTIGNLKQLRFLALNCTQIRRLPELIHKLYNLQTLELKGCPFIQELPRGMSNLINLRHLDVEGSDYLVHKPLPIKNLTSLQKLPTFILHKGNEFCGIRELQELVNLRELGISGLCNVTDLDDAKKANMQNKTYLKILKLTWPSNGVALSSEQFGYQVEQIFLNAADETDEEDESNVYDHENARNSIDEQYSEHENPSSCDIDDNPVRPVEIQDEQESNLSSIRLREGISNMGILDSVSSVAEVSEENLLEILCPSTNLEKLFLQSYGGLKFPGWVGNASFFKLMCVEFTDCKCGVLPSLGQLPCLKFLSIDGMPLELVGREFCGTGNPNAFPKLETLSFHNMNKWKSWGGTKEGDFPNLNKLCLFNCPQLRRLPDFFSSLKILEVDRCMELTDVPELPSLEVLDICCCGGLAALPTLKSLCRLTIMYCQKLKALSTLPQLESLWIENCEQLTSIVFCGCSPSCSGLSCTSSNLKSVLIANCRQLCFLSREPLTHIQYFEIDGCLILSKMQEDSD